MQHVERSQIDYPITPVPKPRMTRRDAMRSTTKYPRRPGVARYDAFKQECLLRKVAVPESGSHITFYLPMPKSWSKKKKAVMCSMPHQQRPDKDNLEKALLDAIFDEDCRIWDSRVTKRWGYEGSILIET